jgi:15-cis-phytoene synthase
MPRPWPNLTDLAETDLASCRAMLRTGSRTFYAASLLLPLRVRNPAIALYAFCREADDIIDVAGGSSAAVQGLRQRLDRAYQQAPEDSPVDRAFARTVAEFNIPRRLPEALIEGFEWDAEGRRYECLSDLQAYATRVAGTVGAMMAVLMGTRDPNALARACDLGVAMQLTNIARDVGEDARAGRLYLPLEWLDEAGVDPEQWLADPVFDARIASVVQRLLAVAETLYARSQDGIAQLPLDCRPGISAARILYSEIGAEVTRHGFDSISRRAVVSSYRKLALLARALSESLHAAGGAETPVLAEAAFLVDSVVQASKHASLSASPALAWWHLRSKAIRVIELFARLQSEEQFGSSRQVRFASAAAQSAMPIRDSQTHSVLSAPLQWRPSDDRS